MSTDNHSNIELYREKITGFLKSRVDLVAVYLYGSILRQEFNDQSDIDIAIISGGDMTPLCLHELSSELSVITKRDIHLVDFLKASDVLKIEVLKNKTLIFDNDESIRLYHEMNALSSYEKLNEERAIVIKTKYGEDTWTLL